jgi:hypothetical protein
LKRNIQLVVLFVVLILFVCLVWPTQYWYHTTPGTPGHLIRVSRFSGRIWSIQGGHWYNSEERDEIAAKKVDEIKRRCKDAPYPNDSNGVRSDRQIELMGYSFSCP